MKVLVTGANGFLGSWLTRRLIQEGLDVVILRRVKSDLSDILDIRAPHALGDVVDYESLLPHLDGVDTVFHLAGLVAYSQAKRAAMEKVNVDGTQNIVNACLAKNVRRLVHLSSVAAIGASFNPEILNEKSEYVIHPLDIGYFETKRAGEKVVLDAVKEKGLDAVILNPSQIYGRGDARKGSRSTQIKIARGEFPFYSTGGSNIVAVEDVVDGIFKAWQKGRTGERYILAGENLTIKDNFRLIAEAAHVSPPRFFIPTPLVKLLGRFGDRAELKGKKVPLTSETAWTSTLYHWFDSKKAQDELGFSPRPAKEAVEASVSWMRENGYLRKK